MRFKSHRLLGSVVAALVVVVLGLPTLAIAYLAVSGMLWLLPALGRVTSASGFAPDLGLLALCTLAMFGVAIYWSASFKVVTRRPPHGLRTLAVAVIGLVVGPSVWLFPQLKAGLGLSPLVLMPAVGLLGMIYRSYSQTGASNRDA